MRRINVDKEYEIIVYDSKGNIVKHERKKAKSFVRNFAKLIYQYMSMTNQTFTATNGQGFTGSYNSPITATASANDDTRGIQVGYSILQIGKDSYYLPGQLVNTQLQHGESTVSGVIDEEPYWTIRYERQFNNTGSTNITVNRIGLVVVHNNYNVFVWGDAIPDTTVTPGSSIIVRYYLRLRYT